MSIRTSQATITDALKQLHHRWSRVRERWDDPRSREIQQKLIDPLESAVRAAASALDQIAELISTAQRECADDE